MFLLKLFGLLQSENGFYLKLEENPAFAQDLNLFLVKDEKALKKASHLSSTSSSPKTKDLYEEIWHSIYQNCADRVNHCVPPVQNPALNKDSKGKQWN